MSDRPLIASLSGGKDSTAMALWLREQGHSFRAVFLDTGWEAPETYEYLDYLEGVLGQPIIRVQGLETFETLSVRRKAIPMRTARFCTQQLKVFPFLHWVQREYGETPITNAVGIRSAESRARARLSERDTSPEALHVEIWRPILRWSERDVVDCHRRFGVEMNPLYRQGATRVGCYPCIFAGKADLRILPEDRIRRVEALEDAVSAVSAVPHKVAMFTLRDKEGKRHPAPVRDVVAWAHTKRGGREPEEPTLFGAGCMRWGLCE